MDTVELFGYILKIAKGCPSLPSRVTGKLTKVKVSSKADIEEKSRILKVALRSFKSALADVSPDTLDGADQMWRERMLQALLFI
jgi:hypothetical protein